MALQLQPVCSLASLCAIAFLLLLVTPGSEAVRGGPFYGSENGTQPAYCKQSLEDSDGFFCDTDSRWRLRKAHILEQYQRNLAHTTMARMGNQWYQQNWEPEIHCMFTARLGRMGDGGKWICDPYLLGARQPHPANPNRGCLVYSLGSNNEFSFEMDILARHPHCEIHSFDMTSGAHGDSRIKFHAWGIAKEDKKEANLYSLATIQKMLGHEDRQIDIFKIDIEGGEYEVLHNMLTTPEGQKALSRIRVMAIEIHFWYREGMMPFPPEVPGDIMGKVAWANHFIFKELHKHGFAIYFKEPNIEFSQGERMCIEYALVRLNKDFFTKPGK